jgi:hypothetical protein
MLVALTVTTPIPADGGTVETRTISSDSDNSQGTRKHCDQSQLPGEQERASEAGK